MSLFFAPSDTALLPLNLGEVDEFRVTEKSEVVIRRPMGYNLQSATLKPAGCELSFKGGKVDWHLARWIFLANRTKRGFNRTAGFNVLQSIDHYDGTKEQYLFENIIFYNFEQVINSESPTEETVQAFAFKRTIGPVDTTLLTADGVGWNAVAQSATNVKAKSLIEAALPSDVVQLGEIFLNRPF